MDEELPCRLLLTLLDLPDAKQGRYGQNGVSTRCLQWILAYIIDAQQEGLGSAREVSKYMGFSPCYYEGVKKMLLRHQREIYEAMGWAWRI